MIDVEYQMPDFDEERRLAHPLGIKDSGDWSQDGQSLYIDKVKNLVIYWYRGVGKNGTKNALKVVPFFPMLSHFFQHCPILSNTSENII